MNTIPLHESILKAKRAIKRAGFQSAGFKPKGATLTVDVLVPVTFEDFGPEEAMTQYVWDEIARMASVKAIEIKGLIGGRFVAAVEPSGVSTIDGPGSLDLRTKKGREWKKRRQAVTA